MSRLEEEVALDRLAASRDPVEPQRDSIEASWRRSARQRARRRAEAGREVVDGRSA